MKSILTLAILLAGSITFGSTKGAQNFAFQYKTKNYKNFTIIRSAASKEEAYRLAAKDCFKQLTNNKYPGEEKGLEIIDICANPKI
jgi:hypothetical protein